MFSKPFRLFFTLLALPMAASCGGGDTVPRANVQGTISFQGTPIESGIITFVPVQGVQGASVQLKIIDGKYNSTSDQVDSRGIVIGQNDVQILATKKTGKQIKNPDNQMEDEVIQYIPAKYNTSTELHEEVKAGDNNFNFDLK